MNGMENSPEQIDAIIIGGGATGAGIARDLALRGLKVLILEKKDFAEGTTGRCHGLLHSGGRYVATDKVAARECAQENQILQKIAAHIIDNCGGYFVALTEEDLAFSHTFPEFCQECGVFCEEVLPEEFLQKEPSCNPEIKRVFRVNDAYIDPFLLTYYNLLDAKNHGAIVKAHCEVEHLILTENEIVGVRYHDSLANTTANVYADFVINATGPWAVKLESDLKLAQPLQVAPTQGTLIVMKNRVVSSVINHLRPPQDGDIIVPSHQSIILGTSSLPTDIKGLDMLSSSFEEIDALMHEAEVLIPSVRTQRMIRYYTGARPLIVKDSDPEARSRKFDILDYEAEGFSHFVSVIGGKLTTYRLMAEKVADLVCSKLGVEAKCTTHERVLPGADRVFTKEEIKELFHVDDRIAFDMSVKWGSFIGEMGDLCVKCLDAALTDPSNRIVCECEKVSEQELKWAKDNLFVQTLDDYRRRTRQGMGPCQGQFCYFKLADLEVQWAEKSHAQLMEELKEALEKRWKTEDLVDDLQKRQIKLAKYMYLLGGNI